MATHRSLNKLEFKAHMSIHDFTEVREEEAHESTAFTRDRLGKKHLLSDENGQPRVANLRKRPAILALALLLLAAPALYADAIDTEAGYVKKKGPNVQVSSGDAEVRSVSSWMNGNDPKPTFYQSGDTAVGFNNDGDPNVSTRF